MASPPTTGSSGSRCAPWSGSTIDSTGTRISRSSGRVAPTSTIVARRVGPTMKRATSSSGRCVAESPIRCRLRAAELRLQPLDAQREVRAALGARDGVDLVEDHGPHVGEDLAGLRGQHQVQRLGRGDQDVRGVAQHRGTLARRRVAGADRHAHLLAEAEAAERRAQVALDVVGERLQRGHVEQARAVIVERRGGDKAVEAPEERGERLARAGRGADQDVLAGRDRRPRLRLRRGRRFEGVGEPVTDEWGEGAERHAVPTLACAVAGRHEALQPLSRLAPARAPGRRRTSLR